MRAEVFESFMKTVFATFLVGSAMFVSQAEELTSLAEIRRLPASEIAKNLPVKVDGVVTWCAPGRLPGGFMIDQKGSGIFVVGDRDLPDGRKAPGEESIRKLTPGDKVKIEAVTRFGGFAPELWLADVRVVGKAPVPNGKEVGLGNLLTGTYDAQRVALKGVITGCRPSGYGDGTWVMVLAGASGKARAIIPAMPGMTPEDIEDAGVLIRGVVFTRCNSRKEFVGLSIETTRTEDIQIYRAGGTDPFGVQMLEVGRLRAFLPGGHSQHRRRIRGVVTLTKPGVLYLQGPSGGSRVSTRSPEISHAVGDLVEAAGFVEPYLGTSELASALTQKREGTQMPQPVALSMAGDQDPGGMDGVLVRMRGVVLESHLSPQGIETLLTDEGKSFRAILAHPLAGAKELIPGAEVLLTGVAEITYELGPYFPDQNVVSGVRLLLRTPADVVVHRVPPWWNARRLLIALGLSVTIATLLAGAAILLMRRVRAQANQLAAEALVHRQVTAAHDAMMEERSRLAGEMHDGLQPMLSGLSFYLEAADSKLKGGLHDSAEETLERSRTLLSRIRDEFRQCIWCLYELGRQTGDLDNELRRLARVQRQWSHAEVNTEIHGEPFFLPASISREVLLICQEAVENASRHGKASRIDIACRFLQTGLEISVIDDGCGFDVGAVPHRTGPHFGMAGMRHRIERLGGWLDVVSKPGEGTRLNIQLSRDCIWKAEANPLASSEPIPKSSKTLP